MTEEQRQGLADLHVHTNYSDGSDSPAEVLAWAAQLGVDVIAITDHDTIDGAEEAAELACTGYGPDVIVGEEISSRDGHVIGLFLSRRVPHGLSAAETIAAVHDQGGIAVAAHPYWRTASAEPPGYAYSVGDDVESLEFDAIEVLNGSFSPGMILANRQATEAAHALGYRRVGGSNAHVRHAIGWAHTRFQGRNAADLRWSITAGLTRTGRSRPALSAMGSQAAWSISRRRTARGRLQRVAG